MTFGTHLPEATSGCGRFVMLKKTLNVLLVSGAIVTLVACNTVRGAGEDVQSAANAVDNKT
jgi:predicted small secreted protein